MNDAPENETPSIATLLNELSQLASETASPVVETRPTPTQIPAGEYQEVLLDVEGGNVPGTEVFDVNMVHEVANFISNTPPPTPIAEPQVISQEMIHQAQVSQQQVLQNQEINLGRSMLEAEVEFQRRRVENSIPTPPTPVLQEEIYPFVDFPGILNVQEGLEYELLPWQTGCSNNMPYKRTGHPIHYKLRNFVDALQQSLPDKFDIHVFNRECLFVVINYGDILCKNTENKSYLIKDMYISFYVRIETRSGISYVSISSYLNGFDYNFLCSKLFFTSHQFKKGLVHPHRDIFSFSGTPDRIKRCSSFLSTMCLGSSELRELIREISITENCTTLQFSLFLFTLASFLEWDSPDHYPSARLEYFTEKTTYQQYVPPGIDSTRVLEKIIKHCYEKEDLEIPIIKTPTGITIDKDFLNRVIEHETAYYCLTNGTSFYRDDQLSLTSETIRVPGFIFRNEDRCLVIEKETEDNLTRVVYPKILQRFEEAIKTITNNSSSFNKYFATNEHRTKTETKIDNIKLHIESDSEPMQQISYAGMEWATLVR